MSLKIRILPLSKSINILFLKIKVWSLKKTEQKLSPPTTDNSISPTHFLYSPDNREAAGTEASMREISAPKTRTAALA